jgi:hypothetical protein
MRIYGGVEVQFHLLLTYAISGCKSTLPPIYLMGRSPMYLFNRRLGEPAESVWKRSRKHEYLTPVGNKVNQKTEKRKAQLTKRVHRSPN